MKMVNLRLYEEKLAKKRLRSIRPKVNYDELGIVCCCVTFGSPILSKEI